MVYILVQIILVAFCFMHYTKAHYNKSVINFDEQYEVQDKIVNHHNFEYILNPKFDVCGNRSDNVFLLIYVHSSPENYKRRIAIRETWAKRSIFDDIRIVFMLGKGMKTKRIDDQGMITLESNTYNDIVQENFQDSYRNLTFKGIMAMKWIAEYCNHTEFILKADDDIITNTFKLLRYLKSLSKHNIYNTNSVICSVWDTMHVICISPLYLIIFDDKFF
jgi:beta-1,3-galactosyltransferase 1